MWVLNIAPASVRGEKENESERWSARERNKKARLKGDEKGDVNDKEAVRNEGLPGEGESL